MSDLTHDQARQYIEAAAEKRLGSPERLELDQHLSTCRDCRGYAEELEELEGSVLHALHMRWDSTPIPASSPRLVLQKIRRTRLQRQIWTAAQVLAGAAAIFILIFAMENLVGPKGARLPTAQPSLQAALSLPITTPFPTYAISNLPTSTPARAPTLAIQDRPLATQPRTKPYIYGKVVNGYGDHAPAANLPLALDQSGNSLVPQTTTDAQGQFILSGISLGEHTLQSAWFSVPFTLASQDEAIDLGVIKYPLVHPPLFMSRKPSSAPDLSTLKTQSKQLPFQVIFNDPTWQRPSESVQRDQVWAHQPFTSHGQIFFDWWFKQPAVLYDTLDIFTNGIPGGPDLNPIGADWRYLLGLWNTQNFLTDPSYYSAKDLNNILQRQQLEIWLLGYQADEVRQLGDHYLVSVHPATGVQVIRFQGNQAALAVHIVSGDQEITRLPKVCRTERDLDCGSEGS